MNLLWENPSALYPGEQYTNLCDNSKADDFYFDVKFNSSCSEGYTLIILVPKAYFDKYGELWDQSMYLEHILPDDFVEAMESVWDSEREPDDITSELIALGFEENKRLGELFNECYE